ncbi:MAG: Mov34/MPN/PAD-1 family protein [Alphaproteobacteria bacterium]|nr:Mov34/MPN/PAD-1 family protein [Alphaproteobacteria bacterium]
MKSDTSADPGPLVFHDRREEFEVAFEQSATVAALSLCASSPRVETGGILVGRYVSSGRRAQVSEATGPPPGSSAGRDWFRRGNRGLAKLLAERWDSEPRTYYLGEWHFHPDRVPWPSSQDLRQMHEVAADPRYQCSNPILLVVSPIGVGQWSLQVFVFGAGDVPVGLSLADTHHDGQPLGPLQD